MESWRKVWRKALAPLLSTAGLEALQKALIDDSPRLIQGQTTSPAPMQCVHDWPVEAACGIGFCGWKGDGLVTVAEVEAYFGEVCHKIDAALGEPAGCRWFTNWFDETDRDVMRRELLTEVNRTLVERQS